MGAGRGDAIDELSEDEKRALRGSKFAPLNSLPSSSRSHPPRLAHPGGPLNTNKAAALAKFLERKLQNPNGLASIDPDLLDWPSKTPETPLFRVGLRIQEEQSNTLPHLKMSRYLLMTIRLTKRKRKR